MFGVILNSIESEEVREFAQRVIDNAPPYFFHVPASSTGKYHPAFSLGDGGLVRHTIALCRYLNHMFAIECIGGQFTERQRDLMRVAGLAHDMWKSGTQEEYEKSKYTKFDHPLIAAQHIRQMDGLPQNQIEFVAHCIESHMGQWNTDKRRPNVILPKPQDKYQIILHLADYLASRKDIDMKFDGGDSAEVVSWIFCERSDVSVPVSEPGSLPDINTWIFPYGKYKGKTIPEVNAENPGYIKWAKENMEKEPARSLLQTFAI